MIFGALVILLIALALAILVVPVLRKPPVATVVNREQQNIAIAKEKKQQLEDQLSQGQMSQLEYDSAFLDLEASLALDLEHQQALVDNKQAGQWVVWAFVLFVPLVSIFLYFQLGSYQVIENPSIAKAKTQTQNVTNKGKPPSMSELIDKLKNHLRDNPEDHTGWFMMGRTLMSLQQYDEAVIAYQRSYDIAKDTDQMEPSILLALADAMAVVNDGKMEGKPFELVQQALELSPQEPTALWLAGLSAEQSGDFSTAYDYLNQLLPLLADDPQSAAEVKSLIASLKESHPELPDLEYAPEPIAKGVLVSISLNPEIASKAGDDDLLFVYAKAAKGSVAPLAAKRLKVSDLPAQLSLSDADAMMPQMTLSMFDEIIVGARISKSGNPVGQAGDLYSESKILVLDDIVDVIKIDISQIHN